MDQTKLHFHDFKTFTACGLDQQGSTLQLTDDYRLVTCQNCIVTNVWRSRSGNFTFTPTQARAWLKSVAAVGIRECPVKAGYVPKPGEAIYGVYAGPTLLHRFSASVTDFADVCAKGKQLCEKQGYTLLSVLRPLTNTQLADLSTKWENPTVDTRKYVQTVMQAWETDRKTFLAVRNNGGLCQQDGDRYYIA